MDRNFSAEHLKMWWPETDVQLSDGLSFMVTSKDYQAHLKLAVEHTQVCFKSFCCMEVPDLE
jgi:hypothetical protein